MIKSLKELCLGDQNDFKKSGVYIIKHSHCPDYLYVGSTAVSSYHTGLYRRWWRHFYELKTKTHCNKKLQRVVNKYGLDGISFEIIEICSPENCINREQYWMDKLNPYYNIVKIAGKTTGYKHTKDYIKKRSKPVLQYSVNGVFIQEFESAKKAEEITKIPRSCITSACNGSNSIGKNYQWKYKENEIKKNIPKYFKKTSNRIICYDKNGKFFKEFNSLLEASNILNIPTGNISKHISNNTSICYNYIFKTFKENYPLNIVIKNKKHKKQLSLKILNLETNEVLNFASLRKAHLAGFDRGRFTHYINKNIFEYILKKKYKVTIIKN